MGSTSSQRPYAFTGNSSSAILSLATAAALTGACTLITDVDRNRIVPDPTTPTTAPDASMGGSSGGGTGGTPGSGGSTGGTGTGGMDASVDPADAGTILDAGAEAVPLELLLTGLEPLNDLVYEAWVTGNGDPVSVGRFNITPGTAEYGFELPRAMALAATTFMLSLEPNPDADPDPSQSVVLAGAFDDGVASLSVEHPLAFNTDFSAAAGSFVLNTPSTGLDDSDYRQGVGFLDPAGPSASLTLPTLPPGWIYEGWVANSAGAFSTGRFADPGAADLDEGGPGAGSGVFPPFPGQDFITPPLMLTGNNFETFISVEPDPDDGSAPFVIRPLTATIEDDGIDTPQALTNDSAANNPVGTVTLGL